MEKVQVLQSEKAVLESKVDLLEAEISYLQELLMRCGFEEGIKSLKQAAEEVLVEERRNVS